MLASFLVIGLLALISIGLKAAKGEGRQCDVGHSDVLADNQHFTSGLPLDGLLDLVNESALVNLPRYANCVIHASYEHRHNPNDRQGIAWDRECITADRYVMIVPRLSVVVLAGEQINWKARVVLFRAQRFLHSFGIRKGIVGRALRHADEYNIRTNVNIQSNGAAYILNTEFQAEIDKIVSLGVNATVPVEYQWMTRNRPNDLYPRSIGRLKLLLDQSVGVAHLTILERCDTGIEPCANNGPYRNRTVSFVVGLLLLLISAKFLQYGIWNIYDGPCNWRGVASLWIGWVPFAVGLWMRVSLI
jgi:hypothetical protein